MLFPYGWALIMNVSCKDVNNAITAIVQALLTKRPLTTTDDDDDDDFHFCVNKLFEGRLSLKPDVLERVIHVVRGRHDIIQEFFELLKPPLIISVRGPASYFCISYVAEPRKCYIAAVTSGQPYVRFVRDPCRGRSCAVCSSSNVAPFTCGSCLSIPYCSRSCQLTHWSTHKLVCKGRNLL